MIVRIAFLVLIMAYVVFQIPASGGSDTNSGTSASVVYTTSGATWDGTSQITGITGAGAVQVGDWVNVGGTYVAQVTVASATALTLSSSLNYGPLPSAGTYTITDGGYWATICPIVSILASTALPASTQIQIQTGNSSLNLGGTTTLSVPGTSGFQVWYRGFNTTPGDLDNGSTTLTYPTINVGSTNSFSFLGANFTLVSGFVIESIKPNVATITATGENQSFRHCTISNGGSGATAYAVTLSANQAEFTNCNLSAGSSATEIINQGSNSASYSGCRFQGQGIGGSGQTGLLTGGNTLVFRCTFYQCSNFAIRVTATTSLVIIAENTFYQSKSSHISSTGSWSSGMMIVVNNTFIQAGTNGSGFDVTAAGGAGYIKMLNNSWYDPASGHTNGLGDSVFDNELEETSVPVVSSTNLALVSTALGANGGLPQQWEGITAGLGGFPDTGAWQRQVTSGGSGGSLSAPIMNQGWQYVDSGA